MSNGRGVLDKATAALSYIVLIGVPLALAITIWRSDDRSLSLLLALIGAGAGAALAIARKAGSFMRRVHEPLGILTIFVLVGLGFAERIDLVLGPSFGYAWLLASLPDWDR